VIDRASRHKRLGWWVFAALSGFFVLFFAYTLYNTAISSNRKGDLDVYLKAAWAARTGGSLYEITDQHGWHYLYPPLLASVLIPLANPPDSAPPEAKTYLLPYWVSATIWYWFSVGCLLIAVETIVRALEEWAAVRGRAPPRRFSNAWWAPRLLPLLLVIFYVGDGLARSQTTLIVLLCLAGSAAAILRGRSFSAGIWLGTAGILKLFPLYLLLYPLFRRDGRCLAGAALAIAVGLLLPVVIMGPSASLAAYHEFFATRLIGEVKGSGDESVTEELHGTNSRIQSFEYIVYDALHPDRTERAAVPPLSYFMAHIAISLLLTAGVLLAMRRRADGLSELLFFGTLALLAIPILPESRPHYYALGLLVLAGFCYAERPGSHGIWLGWPVALAAGAFTLAGLLDAIGLPFALEYGLATLAAMWLGSMALLETRRRGRHHG
jgi:glycosyl transferase family 87